MVRFASAMYLCAHYNSDTSSFGWWLDDVFSDVTTELSRLAVPDQVTDINSNLLTKDDSEVTAADISVETRNGFDKLPVYKRKLTEVIERSLPTTGGRLDVPRSRSTSPRLRRHSRLVTPRAQHLLDVSLIRSIETDSEPLCSLLDSPRERFFKAVTEVNSRLRSLQLDNDDLLSQVDQLKQGFEELETDCDALIQETKHLHKEIQDLRYMDDLLLLLNGQVERIALRQWPFAVANSHQQLDRTNLIV